MVNKDAFELHRAITEGQKLSPRVRWSKFEHTFLNDIKGCIERGKDLTTNQSRVLQQLYRKAYGG
jgi:hypothetical protein